MEYFVKAFAILIIAVGAISFVTPAFLRKLIELAKVGKRVYVGGVIRIVVGTLLLIAAPNAITIWIPGIIGALILLSGILILVLGVQKIHSFMDKVYSLSDQKIRVIPTIAIILGILLIYSV
ncbi:MAG: hypothetical protein COS89_05705 [Deltaproteobacteria bacterium CG07_land_8_20_14_0_80_38_7]|nr:MAG: hypothetical protein COS89_05705 [Deltaproteobacteria bacterium CG07_land_8_20_14_0_80_38_7]